jgi:hypothetical protein
MKRLYNEYSMVDSRDNHANFMRAAMDAAVGQIWDYVEKNELCPRDVENFCTSCLHVDMAERMIRRSLAKSKADRAKESSK